MNNYFKKIAFATILILCFNACKTLKINLIDEESGKNEEDSYFIRNYGVFHYKNSDEANREIKNFAIRIAKSRKHKYNAVYLNFYELTDKAELKVPKGKKMGFEGDWPIKVFTWSEGELLPPPIITSDPED